MTIPYNEFLAVVYAQVFNSTLTKAESKKWAIGKVTKKVPLPKDLKIIGEHYESALLAKKLMLAHSVAQKLSSLSLIEGIFLTGSLAAGSAKKDSDIDLLIICQPYSLWLVRFLVVSYLKLTGNYRSEENFNNKVCPNMFLETGHLLISKQNLFTAHEVLQVKTLVDNGGVNEQWLETNSWTKKYLPFASNKLKVQGKKYYSIILWPVNFLLFLAQYLYMYSKITNERITLHQAFFHPKDLSTEVLTNYERKLVKYGYGSKSKF